MKKRTKSRLSGLGLIIIVSAVTFSILSTTIDNRNTLETDIGNPRHEIPPSEWESPPDTIIEQGSGVEAASYIIFLDDDGVCYAKSGDNGEIMYSGDNETVIQAAITNSNGGKVFIREGTYVINDVIDMDVNNVTFAGSGKGTILKAKTNLDDSIIYVTVENTVVRDMTIDGNRTNQSSAGYGIYLSGAAYALIDGVSVRNCYDDGIRLWDVRKTTIINSISDNHGRDSIVTDNSYEIIVSNNHTSDMDRYGIYFANSYDSSALGNVVENSISYDGIITANASYRITIVGNIIKNCNNDGIVLDNTKYATVANNVIFGNGIRGRGAGIFIFNAHGSTITGNVIENNGWDGIRGDSISNFVITGNVIMNNSQKVTDNYDGIFIYDDGTNASAKNLIAFNRIMDNQSTTTQRYGINLTESTWGTRVIGNELRNNKTGAALFAANTVDQIAHNSGYITENSGIATIPNGKENLNVVHGMSVVPTIVVITGAHSEVSAAWVENISADNFDIALSSTVSANRDVYWYAENSGW